MEKPSEQSSGGFSYVCEHVFIEKSNFLDKTTRVDYSYLRHIGARNATIDYSDRHTKNMFSFRSSEWGDKTRFRTKPAQDNYRSQESFSSPILFRPDIDSESTPPHLSHRIQTRLLYIRLFLHFIPSIVILPPQNILVF